MMTNDEEKVLREYREHAETTKNKLRHMIADLIRAKQRLASGDTEVQAGCFRFDDLKQIYPRLEAFREALGIVCDAFPDKPHSAVMVTNGSNLNFASGGFNPDGSGQAVLDSIRKTNKCPGHIWEICDYCVICQDSGSVYSRPVESALWLDRVSHPVADLLPNQICIGRLLITLPPNAAAVLSDLDLTDYHFGLRENPASGIWACTNPDRGGQFLIAMNQTRISLYDGGCTMGDCFDLLDALGAER